jgi:hypothetical protein
MLEARSWKLEYLINMTAFISATKLYPLPSGERARVRGNQVTVIKFRLFVSDKESSSIKPRKTSFDTSIDTDNRASSFTKREEKT